MEKKATRIYLFWTFACAWVLQITASLLDKNGGMLFGGLLAVSMYVPLFATWMARKSLSGMGWKPVLKRKKRYYLIAWFFPTVLGTIGAVLYYLLFSNRLDWSAPMVVAQIGASGLEKLAEQGLNVKRLMGISFIQAITYAPWLNMLFAVGEEAGWRGFLYPNLKASYGVNVGRVLGGVIWGVWHWPVMLLAGYEYGKDYIGAPVLGPILFCVFTVVAGIILDELYEKTESIWAPALGHGAINAFAGVTVMMLNPDYANALILGPSMIGVIGGLPMILAAVWICYRRKQ